MILSEFILFHYINQTISRQEDQSVAIACLCYEKVV